MTSTKKYFIDLMNGLVGLLHGNLGGKEKNEIYNISMYSIDFTSQH